jgi:hypothetical protein
MSGTLENRFSKNVFELEKQADVAMAILSKYAKDNILPVNVAKTKALLVHNVVAPPYPKVKYNGTKINFVNRFKYLGIDITTKIGWELYIQARIKKIRKIYHTLSIIFKKIPVGLIHLRRKLFFAYALPHFIWLLSCWFFYTEIQQRTIEHTYCLGLRLTYNMKQWDDLTVYALAEEYTLTDYLFKYWLKFSKHLEISAEAHQYQLTFNSYLFAKSSQSCWYLSMGMRKNSNFLKRLSENAHHSKIDIFEFLNIHGQQYGYYRVYQKFCDISYFAYISTSENGKVSVFVSKDAL